MKCSFLRTFSSKDSFKALPSVPGREVPLVTQISVPNCRFLTSSGPHTSTARIPVLHPSVDRRCRYFYPIRGPKGHTITLPEWRCGRGGFALGYMQPQIDSVMAKAR